MIIEILLVVAIVLAIVGPIFLILTPTEPEKWGSVSIFFCQCPDKKAEPKEEPKSAKKSKYREDC